MPQGPGRIALLQAVPLFRFRRAVRMHPADPGAHLSQRREEYVQVLRIPHDHRKRYRANVLYSAFGIRFRSLCSSAPHGRPPGLRESVQEVAAARNPRGGPFSKLVSPSPRSSKLLHLSHPPRKPQKPLRKIPPSILGWRFTAKTCAITSRKSPAVWLLVPSLPSSKITATAWA